MGLDPRWRHNRERLLLPVAVYPGLRSDNPFANERTEGLLDTGATGTGIRSDLASRLSLRPKGQRRVYTANGVMLATEYVIRLGFVVGDYTDPDFRPDQQQPYVLDRELIGFELQSGFAWPVLIGMDVIGQSDLSLTRNGVARLLIA